MKQCTKCLVTKPETQFYRRSDGRKKLHNYCRECQNTTSKQYYAAHRHKAASGERRRNYSLSEERFVHLMADQKGLCKICQRPETVKKGAMVATLSVDHDHATNKIRGLLCDRCNRGIGLFGDSRSRLLRAADYLSGLL